MKLPLSTVSVGLAGFFPSSRINQQPDHKPEAEPPAPAPPSMAPEKPDATRVGSVELVGQDGFHCQICTNDPARCSWCADHIDDAGVISCGDCQAGKRAGARPSWLQGVTPNSRGPVVPDSIRAKIEAIEPEARRLGWEPERLWNANFWDGARGLAAVLDEGDEIAEVTEGFISILKIQRHILRFQRRVS
jgi:hypothetical protein